MNPITFAIAAAAAVVFIAASPATAQVDVSAAEALMKKSGCTKCHAVAAKLRSMQHLPEQPDLNAAEQEQPTPAPVLWPSPRLIA